ncbi:hypothetical protein BJV78DRAFT_431128 [Lactifluus subvellereus]|nr:hypothetical protein BJV78DRAFT_431128 [Lactifluus subvellereus]
MTSTVRAAASAPLSSLLPSSGMMTDPSPSPPQETHRPASGILPQRPQPIPPQLPSQPPGMEAEPSPWNQVHPSLIDQLVSFEAQIAPSPTVGGYTHGHQQQYESPHTPHTPFPFSTSMRSASPPRLPYLQPGLPGRPPLQIPQYTGGSSSVSAMPDGSAGAGAVDPRWAVPHMDMQPQFVRPRTPPSGSRAHDRVLRQSGSLSLTEVWSQLVTQMDIAPTGSQRSS